MFHVEKMETEDFQFAVELAKTMNWNMTIEDFDFNKKLEPDGCFVLFHGQQRVGVVTCVSYGRIGWFGNLIVNEVYRGKGAGTLLVKHAIDYLKNSGVTTIGLYAYPHLANFYGNLGFKYSADFIVLKAETVSPIEVGKQITPKKQDIPALIEFDSQCFGASRKKILTHILLQKGNLCYISAESGEINGYVAAKVYGELAELGPLVCRGNRRDTAVTLLKTALAKLKGLEVFMCMPAAEKALLDTAARAGFREEFRVARMFLGSAVAENCVYIAESLERG
jgi:predicted N-acetyltransferase YhbS